MGLFATATALNNVSTNILSAFGLNGWQLKNGKYNGCTFTAFVAPGLQGSQLFQEGVNTVAQYNQYFGSNNDGKDPNRLGQLFNTTLGAIQFTDRIITGTVQKVTPYTNSINIEDTGFRGYEFKMTLLFLGDDYMKALINFENAFSNPPSDSDNYLVLEHPTRGKIPGYTYIVNDPEIIHSLSYWCGAIVNITFRSVTKPTQIKPPALSTTQKIARALTTALGAVAAVGGAIGTVTGFANNIKSGGLPFLAISTSQQSNGLPKYNQLTTTSADKINSLLINLSNILFNCICYIYQKGNPGIDIATLDKAVINYNYLPPSLNQSPIYTISQGAIIMNYYYAECIRVIAEIDAYYLGPITNDMIIEVSTSITKLSFVCQTIGDKVTYNTFVTPYNMSIRRVLNLNNIGLTNTAKIMSINPQILSANYIPANTLVNLI